MVGMDAYTFFSQALGLRGSMKRGRKPDGRAAAVVAGRVEYPGGHKAFLFAMRAIFVVPICERS
jgi:hypothetical protein